ncbi:hypothetical protein FRC00_007817, partial [Tulasnella sp. 408]
MHSLAEPLILESIELKYKKPPNSEAWNRNEQMLRYLDSYTEKHPLVKYLVVEHWQAVHSTILDRTIFPLWIGKFTNLRGIYLSSAVINSYLFRELFKLPRIEFVELKDPVV